MGKVRDVHMGNLCWVVDQVGRYPLATLRHLERVSDHQLNAGFDPEPPQRSTIGSLLTELREPTYDRPRLLVPVDGEPGGATGYVLSFAGLAEWISPGARLLGCGDDVDFERESEPSVEVLGRTRPHTRLTTDLGVVMLPIGEVVTEYEVQLLARKKPETDQEEDSESADPPSSFRTEIDDDLKAPTRRPDLMVRLGDYDWAVEVERTAKGGTALDPSGEGWTSTGEERYRVLARKHAQGGFAISRGATYVGGAWYLTNHTEPSKPGSRRRTIADRVVAGVFDAADDVNDDLLLLVDPLPLDYIAARPFPKRMELLKQAVDRALPTLRYFSGFPEPEPESEVIMTGYLMPSMHETKPKLISKQSVVVVGRLTDTDESNRTGIVRVDGRDIKLVEIPFNQTAKPLARGERVTVFGELHVSRLTKLVVERIRVTGVDWEPTPQKRSAEGARVKREAKRAAEGPRRGRGRKY